MMLRYGAFRDSVPLSEAIETKKEFLDRRSAHL